MDYYRENAEAFVSATRTVDMQPLYRRFLPLVPKGGHILDAGCGSGRDARHFLELGYRISAFDAVAEIAVLAEQATGVRVEVRRFQELDEREAYDAIWACASLLHVPAAELAGAFARLAQALRPGGVLYCSFKHGRGEREAEGRRFTDLDEAGLAELIAQTPTLRLIDELITGDQRPERADERWLNALLRRVG